MTDTENEQTFYVHNFLLYTYDCLLAKCGSVYKFRCCHTVVLKCTSKHTITQKLITQPRCLEYLNTFKINNNFLLRK